MTAAHELDADRARTAFERSIIQAKNAGKSWPTIARELSCSVSIARNAWGRANHHQRGNPTHHATTTYEDATIGNEHLLRGIPVVGIGQGAINGTRPGDPAYRLDRERRHDRA